MKSLVLIASLLGATTVFAETNYSADPAYSANQESSYETYAGRCREGFRQRIPNDGYCENGFVRTSIYECQNGHMVIVSYTCGMGGH